MKKFLLLFIFICGFLLSSNGQQRPVTGTVTSAEDGLPLPGATVTVKGSTIGTITDNNGKYQISVTP